MQIEQLSDGEADLMMSKSFNFEYTSVRKFCLRRFCDLQSAQICGGANFFRFSIQISILDFSYFFDDVIKCYNNRKLKLKNNKKRDFKNLKKITLLRPGV